MMFSNIKTNTNLIYEFDNNIPEWAVRSGEVAFKTFTFEYGHHAATIDDGCPYFGKMLYLREENVSLGVPTIIQNLLDCLQVEILPTVDPDGKFIEVQRIAVNGQTETQTPAAHIDTNTDPSLWTIVYYANDSSGDTLFFNSINDLTEVFRSKFKRGKIVLFPACFAHQALAPKTDWRITVGITFEWHTTLSKQFQRHR